MRSEELLAARGIAWVRAANPGPFTLGGTNSWVVGRDPAWVIDPGPALEAHIEALAFEIGTRGGLGGIALTHGHGDHTEGVDALLTRAGPAPVAAAAPRDRAHVAIVDGEHFGPLIAIATPGHAPDHLAFVTADVCFSGDAVLGEGSVFIAPEGGGLGPYLEGLERLLALDLELICPGHGPVVADPAAKLTEYLEHRLERERRLIAALESGARAEDELLDLAWDDAPAALRPAAALSLRAHLDKLAAEGRLPADVQVAR